MATILYIATAIGLFIVTQTNGGWEMVRHSLKEKAITSIVVSKGMASGALLITVNPGMRAMTGFQFDMHDGLLVHLTHL